MAKVNLNEELMKSRVYAEAEAEKVRAMNGTEPLEGFHLTETGLAERLAHAHGSVLRWCELWNTWLLYDDTRWQIDVENAAPLLAKTTVRALYTEAAAAQDDTYRQQVAKFAVKSESKQARMAMLTLAKGEPPLPAQPQQFDADPWLLNCANGTLDLRTGDLRPHNRADYLTKIIPIAFDPEASCPTWEKFLSEVMGGTDELIDFLWKALGYSLTGICREHCLFFLYGTGRNGKTTFVETTSAVLGDYAKKAAFSTFLMKEHDTVRNDIADLQGARLVSAVEPDKGKHLSESIVKEITGGDTMKARFLHQEFFQFQPQLKLWLAANHKPVIKGTDDGIWLRIRLIPFTKKFEGKDDNKQLGDQLRAELPGILAWMVRGCVAWQEDGLPIPDAIRKATGDYRAEMDVLGNFLEECCEQQPGARTKAGLLYNAYVTWSSDKQMTQTAFGRELTERGIGREKIGSHVYRIGLTLTTEGGE